MTARPLLEVDGLTVEYGQGRAPSLRAVDGVSFDVRPGETVGLVGESGSGKSTIARAVLGLTPVHSGEIRFDGADITRANRGLRRTLSARLQMVFQDPYSSLNPARTIGQTLAEPLLVHHRLRPAQVDARVAAMLERVGLPAQAAERYPAQFSGGQRQRVAIARALMTSAELVVCDEPVSALDLSIQAQTLNLLSELQRELSLSYLFIAHDLPVVRYLSHRVVVLYHGAVMETGPVELVYERPAHPYTRALLAAVPDPDPRVRSGRHDAPVAAAQAAPRSSAVGCPFAPRCAHAVELCRTERPPLLPLRGDGVAGGAAVACHRAEELISTGNDVASGTVAAGLPKDIQMEET
ncbi:ABC transporter ATP-binding protein [Streptosporangium carneum]|uniref:Glutathione import ATP-binding protein GsiA n=1 Tax=Streptosporangium carneum TaxID=47481 RepID=A0A9W6ME75_9ACTN|nr:oligopeptide/dipeptide ABC transporter ATP-binding protein [Streptosporangium carneum]GLK10588.1 ABC transporter ATP-binding protein [Streptosporangium carneum]